jgi:acyl-CoA reductase-like NAD-dependent aldehyde dehydrogenase
MTEFGARRMLIAGEMCEASDGSWLDSVNPATEVVHGRVPVASSADVDRAVAAAAGAQIEWAQRSIWERGALLRELGARLRTVGEETANIEAADTGNTIASLGGDVEIAASYLEYFAGLGTEMKGETVPASPGNYHFTVREPYGVVGRIVPFNHPFLFAAAHLAAPLMAGNAVVLKSAEQSPLSASIIADACREVLPPGLVNIVSGPGMPTGDALVRHPGVPRLGFTGSAGTGMAIQRSAAEVAVKRITLELGGKNPMLVFPDACATEVADAAVAGMNFAWSGQSCGSTSRILVHDSLYDEVVDRIAAMLEKLQVGDPRDPASQMGPVNNRAHFKRVMAHIETANVEGARLVTGGQRPSGAEFERGFWVLPTLFADVDRNMSLACKEVFGPVLAVMRWSDEEELLSTANDSQYGLTAGIWTEDIGRAMHFANQVQAGYVWINSSSRHFVGTPFGGWKNSGLGGEECLDELLSYTQLKTVHVVVQRKGQT